jgi:hypothetical protein
MRNIEIKIETVKLIKRAHQCSDEEAIQICYDLATGARKAMTNEQLRKAVGLPQKPYTEVIKNPLYSLTRQLKVVPEPFVASFDQPKHSNKQNGKTNRDIVFDAIARGKSLIPEGPPPGHTKLESEKE